ncbi:hypothetical protein ACFE04_012523 [Oxalis oulophora]
MEVNSCKGDNAQPPSPPTFDTIFHCYTNICKDVLQKYFDDNPSAEKLEVLELLKHHSDFCNEGKNRLFCHVVFNATTTKNTSDTGSTTAAADCDVLTFSAEVIIDLFVQMDIKHYYVSNNSSSIDDSTPCRLCNGDGDFIWTN